MRRALVLLLMLGAAAPAPAAVRALFVGVDRYRFSTTKVPTAEFDDLKGAVGDVRRIKEALAAAYALDLDTGPAAGCDTRNATSITLTDDCADRKAILAALDDRIRASRPADTVIFYFAGHGSRFYDNVEFSQASGYNDTILPTDARDPAAIEGADILDRELRVIIDAATARGVNVWTIFDSCNSGTATRAAPEEGAKRSAPYLKTAGVVPESSTPPVTGAGGGYRVHFGASRDTEESREVRGAGVFTTALVATLPLLAHATFDDIATETALRVAASGHVGQHPQAEGALDATLGGAVRRVTVLRGTASNGVVTLLAGTLAGMTVGSEVAIFERRIDALGDGGVPRAVGRIASVNASQSVVELTTPPDRPLPANLAIRETRHAYGSRQIAIGIKAQDAGQRALATAAIATVPFALLGAQPQYYLAPGPAGTSGAYLYPADGSSSIAIGDYAATDFADNLRDALEKIARVNALLALRTEPTTASARFCIATGSYDVATCPPPDWKRGHVLAVGRAAQITVKVLGDAERWVYVYGIDPAYAVQLVLPQNGGVDPALRPRSRPLATAGVAPRTPGQYRFVTIATDAPIDARALEQGRAGARDPEACGTDLERLLCEAATGSRDPSTPQVGNWTATVTTVRVEPAMATP